jgi:hypothetical protein
MRDTSKEFTTRTSSSDDIGDVWKSKAKLANGTEFDRRNPALRRKNDSSAAEHPIPP